MPGLGGGNFRCVLCGFGTTSFGSLLNEAVVFKTALRMSLTPLLAEIRLFLCFCGMNSSLSDFLDVLSVIRAWGNMFSLVLLVVTFGIIRLCITGCCITVSDDIIPLLAVLSPLIFGADIATVVGTAGGVVPLGRGTV